MDASCISSQNQFSDFAIPHSGPSDSGKKLFSSVTDHRAKELHKEMLKMHHPLSESLQEQFVRRVIFFHVQDCLFWKIRLQTSFKKVWTSASTHAC